MPTIVVVVYSPTYYLRRSLSSTINVSSVVRCACLIELNDWTVYFSTGFDDGDVEEESAALAVLLPLVVPPEPALGCFGRAASQMRQGSCSR